MGYTVDRSESQIGMEINAPKWFVDPMRLYIIRNSINTDRETFALYCTSMYDAQRDWLTKDNIGPVLQKIVRDLKYPRLPADTDFERYRPREENQDMEFISQMTRYLEVYATTDFICQQPEATDRQLAAINYCGGWSGLIQYARNYSISSAIRMLKDALRDATDYKFAESIAPDNLRIGGTASMKQIIDKTKKEMEEKNVKPVKRHSV